MEQEPVPPPAIDGGTIDDEQTRDASDGDPAEAPVDLAALAALPHRVLRDAELDLLELALGGGVRSGEPVPWQAGEVMTDAENTPLALVGAEGTLRALRSFAEAPGPHWAPEHRIPAAVLRNRDRDVWTALVTDELPTRGDEQRLRRRIAAGERARVLVLAARGGAGDRPGPAVVTGAWLVVAAMAGVEVIAVPWPAAGGLDRERVATAYGASAVVDVAAERSADEVARIAGLEAAWEREVQALYPPISAKALLRARPAAGRPAGTVVFFTGLSGSGKSTIAKAFAADMEAAGRTVTLLDGDEVRHHLSRGLGFDAESRAINIDRIAYVAALVAHHGGLAVAAPIAPFDAGRKSARAMAEAAGGRFILVHVSTPLAVCEARDRKGLYAKARAGQIPEFTGISSPYEAPEDAEVVIDTTGVSVEEGVALVRAALDALGGA